MTEPYKVVDSCSLLTPRKERFALPPVRPPPRQTYFAEIPAKKNNTKTVFSRSL